ncbi:hypothetical protein D3C85_657420 [compost metagenome]
MCWATGLRRRRRLIAGKSDRTLNCFQAWGEVTGEAASGFPPTRSAPAATATAPGGRWRSGAGAGWRRRSACPRLRVPQYPPQAAFAGDAQGFATGLVGRRLGQVGAGAQRRPPGCAVAVITLVRTAQPAPGRDSSGRAVRTRNPQPALVCTANNRPPRLISSLLDHSSQNRGLSHVVLSHVVLCNQGLFNAQPERVEQSNGLAFAFA